MLYTIYLLVVSLNRSVGWVLKRSIGRLEVTLKVADSFCDPSVAAAQAEPDAYWSIGQNWCHRLMYLVLLSTVVLFVPKIFNSCLWLCQKAFRPKTPSQANSARRTGRARDTRLPSTGLAHGPQQVRSPLIKRKARKTSNGVNFQLSTIVHCAIIDSLLSQLKCGLSAALIDTVTQPELIRVTLFLTSIGVLKISCKIALKVVRSILLETAKRDGHQSRRLIKTIKIKNAHAFSRALDSIKSVASTTQKIKKSKKVSFD